MGVVGGDEADAVDLVRSCHAGNRGAGHVGVLLLRACRWGGRADEGRKGSRWMAFGPLSRVEVREGGLIGGEKD